MRRITLLLLTVLWLVGCSSRDGVQRIDPEIRLGQLPGAYFAMSTAGPLAVSYQMSVRNKSSEPISLRRLQIRTVGSAPYVLRNVPVFFKEEILPGKTATVNFTVDAYSQGGIFAADEPILLQCVAHFDSADGSFQKVFTQRVLQPQPSDR